MFVFQLSYFIREFIRDQSELTTRHAQPWLEPRTSSSYSRCRAAVLAQAVYGTVIGDTLLDP